MKIHNTNGEDYVFSLAKVIFIALLIFESDGVVSGLLGIPFVPSRWAYAGLVCAATGVAFLRVVVRQEYLQLRSFFYPVMVFVIFLIVSAVSAGFIFPKPIKDWLPSMYLFTPVFIFYLLYLIDAKPIEVLLGVVFVALTISGLLMIDQYNNIAFLDAYVRRSAFFAMDVRRVVLLKYEVIFGFVILVSIYINSGLSLSYKKIVAGLAGVIFLVQAMIMESRMGFMAMGVSVLTLLYLNGLNKKTLRLYAVGLMLALVAVPIIFKEQIASLGNMSLHDSESNISIRFETVSHYYNLYLQSGGWGLGQMSSNSVMNNVLELEEHYNITDAGFYSSLFQFGPLGLLLWIFLTKKGLNESRKYYQIVMKRDPFSASQYAFLMAFTISLLPISFYTSSSSIFMGGFLLYLTWRFQCERQYVRGDL